MFLYKDAQIRVEYFTSVKYPKFDNLSMTVLESGKDYSPLGCFVAVMDRLLHTEK